MSALEKALASLKANLPTPPQTDAQWRQVSTYHRLRSLADRLQDERADIARVKAMVPTL